MIYYNMPLVIEKETEKAVKIEGGGWLPKSQIVVYEKEPMMMSQRIEIPAWLAIKNGMAPYDYEINRTNIHMVER